MVSPLQAFREQNRERWTVLQDLPSWELDNVVRWIKNVLCNTSGSPFRDDMINRIETKHRLRFSEDLGILTNRWTNVEISLRNLIEEGDYDPVMILLDGLVQLVRDEGAQFSGIFNQFEYGYYLEDIDKVLARLEEILVNGSKWTVVFERNQDAGLTERVDSNLTQTAKDLGNTHLTKAWNKAFSVNPDPEAAIMHAQKAIESIASEKHLTNASTAVYGTLLGDIRANPDKYLNAAKDAYDLTGQIGYDPKDPTPPNERFSSWIATGMDLVQRSNPARHASSATKDFTLDADAGKQSVLIATLLCSLIDSGYFHKAQKTARKTASQAPVAEDA